MRIVIASDSFKGTFSAAEACAAMARGVLRAVPDAEVIERPMADGGEGTLEALAAAWGVQTVEVSTIDAIGRPATGAYALHEGLAVVELATSDGLPGVSDVPLRPRDASTRGTGRVLREALLAGASEVLLCVGGSASTDGGAGILRELGVRLLDDAGRDVPDGGSGLAEVASVDLSGLLPEAASARWSIAVDVTNPLVGPHGAAAVYGPQKGATPDDVAFLDDALVRWAALLRDVTGRDVADLPGAGAAGGVSGGLAAALGADLRPGAGLVAEAVGLEEACRGAQAVFTGEGRFDAQSVDGKVVSGVVAAAGGAPVIVLAGQVTISEPDWRAAGVADARAIGPDGRLENLANSSGRLSLVVE